MDYTKISLGELLSDSDPTIRRNAISILKQLQREEKTCGNCGRKAVYSIGSINRCERCKDL